MELSEQMRSGGDEGRPDITWSVGRVNATIDLWADKVEQLEAENAAAFELLDVYEKENERLRDAIEAWVDAHKSGYCTENYLHCTTSDGLRDALEDGE